MKVARLHLSESPYGPAPTALAAAHTALDATSVYPDPARDELTGVLAARYGRSARHIAVANGSDELVLLSTLTLGALDRPGLTTSGTFPGYRICLESTRRGCITVPPGSADAFAAALPGAGVAYLCNPHNPSGYAMTPGELSGMVTAARRHDVPLVVDEAYLEFAPPEVLSVLDVAGDAPVVALRTFSKAYGLAGLRIGYAVGRTDLIAAIRGAQATMPFSVNRIGQAAAVAACHDGDHVENVRKRNAERRDWFLAEAARRGRSCLPSVTNFVAVAVRDSAAAEALLAEEHGILVRDAGRFGFAGHLRVSLGEVDDLIRFFDALDLIEPAGSAA
nr:histidinol-phosphate transaminase [uncultured Actinoplanes sp.]